MITVRFLGGARKSFSTDTITIHEDLRTIQDLLDFLVKTKPVGTLDFEPEGVLVAINGADSSALGGRSAPIPPDCLITIIPVVHGGSERVQFEVEGSTVEVFPVLWDRGASSTLDDLRKSFPDLTIQAISRRYLLGWSHLQRVLSISICSQRRGIMLSRRLETDILMRFAGTTQISRAISRAGISEGEDFFILAIGPMMSLDLLFRLLGQRLGGGPPPTDNKSFLMQEFQITETHLDAIDSSTQLEDILVEQAAVLF